MCLCTLHTFIPIWFSLPLQGNLPEASQPVSEPRTLQLRSSNSSCMLQTLGCLCYSKQMASTRVCYYLLWTLRQEKGEFKACQALYTDLSKTETFSLVYEETPKTWEAKRTICRKLRKLQDSRNASIRLQSGNSGERQHLVELPTTCSF